MTTIKKNINVRIKTILAIFVFTLIFTGMGVGQGVAGNNLESSTGKPLNQVEKIGLLMEEDKALSHAQAVVRSSAIDAISRIQSSGVVRKNLSQVEKIALLMEEDKALSHAQAVVKSSAMDAVPTIQSSGFGSIRDNMSEAEKVNLDREEG